VDRKGRRPADDERWKLDEKLGVIGPTCERKRAFAMATIALSRLAVIITLPVLGRPVSVPVIVATGRCERQ
jgi:hypothetical protein